jgi:DNA-binding CsgD family transcriptional regulator/tetratricopeptide (TPR) repeat protein
MAAAGRGLLPWSLVAQGRTALDRGDWAAARPLFAAAMEREDTPDACYGLARAEEWAGDFAAAVRHYERAYAGYRARGEVRLPALIAGRELSFLHAAVYGNGAAAGGWLARARSLADEAGECPETGWVELAEAMGTDDPDTIDGHVQVATRIADRVGDADLRFCALGYAGESLVLRGRVAEGMRRVDEAALAATTGEVRDHLVVGEIYCKMLLCCEMVLDVRRAQEWIGVADTSGRASNDLWVSALCRMYYGGILTAAGRWPEAEQELTESLRLHEAGMRAMRAGAAVRLAGLRVRQGRYAEAAQLLAGNESDGQAVVPLARLHLARGEGEVAAAVLRRCIGSVRTTVLHAPALALLAEVSAARGHRDAAEALLDRLRTLASETGLPHVEGLAAMVAGLLAGGSSLPHLEVALVAFERAGLPYEAACSRLAIARRHGGDLPDLAVAEGRAALDTFRALGARRDADEAAQLLRTLGVRAPAVPSPRSPTGLTQREGEVLRLVVEGLSNQQIADRLFLSKRTVEHHVGHIMAKLGVTTRAEALAHGVSHHVP